MNKQTQEVLTILQEEAAEVIVEVSKCFRFGPSEENIQRLSKEIGDLSLMIDLLIKENIGVTEDKIQEAKQEKYKKLMVYSNIRLENKWTQHKAG
jgi:NTP pyrophosphatase (non-canonical NTP hydrolase)